MKKPFFTSALLAFNLVFFSSCVLAEVSNIEIDSRREIADGRDFGTTGAYEQLLGRVFFEIDPENAKNQVITDLSLAPLNSRGMVEMSADIEILKPINTESGNGVALIDIVNRGGKVAMRFNQTGDYNQYGDGFLMQQGYTIVWVGWESDINAGVRIEVPSVEGIANSAIGGLGYAAIRDTASWIKYDPDAVVSTQHTMTFGLSQSGRFLRNYLYLGFNSDEEDRQVFDGVIPHIAGSSRIDLNRRGADTVAPGQFTSTSYPFADQAYRDPATDLKEGMLENSRSNHNQPKIFYVNTSVEYWGGGRVAALVHSMPDGSADINLAENVRAYLLAGTQHGPGAFPPAPASTGQQMGNPMDYWWNLRALLTAMEEWVTDDIEPPMSAHPNFASNTLVPAADVNFPLLPTVQSPIHVNAGTRVANPLLAGNGGEGAALPLLVPQVDSDGNETSGIRHPELSVPLATYTGWNFTNAALGDGDQFYPLAGSYIPFAQTQAQRESTNDPRPSIAERYASKADFLQQIERAGEELIQQRYLRAADLAAILNRAEQHWDLLSR